MLTAVSSPSGNQHSAPGVGLAWLGEVAVFGFGDGQIKTIQSGLGASQMLCSLGAGLLCLAQAPKGDKLIATTDQARVLSIGLNGAVDVLFAGRSEWIDVLAVDQKANRIAFSKGQSVTILDLDSKRPEINIKPPKAATAIAFGPSGKKIAIAHSQGISIFRLPDGRHRANLVASGGPVSVCFSSDEAFVVAGLAEPALAGWRLADGQGFKMGGYPGKPKQFARVAGGKHLATSGGPALLVWPFEGAKGPMGQTASVYRPRLGLVTAIDVQGSQALMGWSDGGVDSLDLASGTARHLAGLAPKADLTDDPRLSLSHVVQVSFSPSGRQAAWIDELGRYGVTAL